MSRAYLYLKNKGIDDIEREYQIRNRRASHDTSDQNKKTLNQMVAFKEISNTFKML